MRREHKVSKRLAKETNADELVGFIVRADESEKEF
jgi:hypothetical protein